MDGQFETGDKSQEVNKLNEQKTEGMNPAQLEGYDKLVKQTAKADVPELTITNPSDSSKEVKEFAQKMEHNHEAILATLSDYTDADLKRRMLDGTLST